MDHPPPPPPPAPSSPSRERSFALQLLDETNIVVTSASAAWFLHSPSAVKAWFLSGAVGAMVVAKIMKHAIREARPSTHRPSSSTARLLARSAPDAAQGIPTYGMPSTHSTTISFYATSALLYAFPTAPGLALAGAAFGAAVAWSRVKLGHHSWPQVAAGVVLGAVLGVGHWAAWVGVGEWEGVMPTCEGGWALTEHIVRRVWAEMR